MRINDQYDINEFILNNRHRPDDEIVRLLVAGGDCSATTTQSAEQVAVRYFNAVRGLIRALREQDAKISRLETKLAETEQTAARLFVKAAGGVVC